MFSKNLSNFDKVLGSNKWGVRKIFVNLINGEDVIRAGRVEKILKINKWACLFIRYLQSTNWAYIPLILPISQKAIFCSNRRSDRFLYNRAYLGIVLSYEKGIYDMGVACKLSLPRPFLWKITYSSKKGVTTLIYMPRPFRFRFTQRDTRAIIPESFIKLSSPILK